MTHSGPLSGVKILDLSTMIAGPWASAILADQGAEVIKIEEPTRGDVMRYVGTRKNDISCAFHMANRGKLGIVLDLRKPEGVEALMCLINTADVFMHNSRPGVMERLGLGYEAVRAVREDIIYASISGFGDTGPLAKKGAYDPVMQCFTGMTWIQGEKDGTPVLLRTIISDKVTALTAAQAISSALYARKNGRGGQQVHVSMLAATAAFSWVDMCRDEAFLDPDVDILPLPTESYRLYRFADGWATVAPAADGVFVSMLRAFGVEDTDDPRIQTLANRMKYPEVAARAMELWQAKIANIPLKEGIARLEAIDVPCAPSLTLAELAMHPHVVETGVFIETEYPGLGLVRETRPAAHFSGTPEQIGGAAPSRGQHTASVLSAAGIDIAAL